MIELGERQTLLIVKQVDFGVYLGEELGTEEKVLLPKKQVPEGAEIGDSINVFIYKDSQDRLISTVREPKINLGETAVLTVSQIAEIGAFLDWGLEKELLLPFKEQSRELQKGDECLVALYLDKSQRFCATMKVYDFLREDSDYKKDDRVEGIAYDKNDQFGMFVAIDGKYSGMIPIQELFEDIELGSKVHARVTKVRDDGRLDLSTREKAYLQMDADAMVIMEKLKEYNGKLPFGDKSPVDMIKAEFHMSKNAFKRAIGRLYKEGYIQIGKDEISKGKREI